MGVGIFPANFFLDNMGLETAFYMTDHCYDCALTRDKQCTFSLTNSRGCVFKETTCVEVEYLFSGCQRYCAVQFSVSYCSG